MLLGALVFSRQVIAAKEGVNLFISSWFQTSLLLSLCWWTEVFVFFLRWSVVIQMLTYYRMRSKMNYFIYQVKKPNNCNTDEIQLYHSVLFPVGAWTCVSILPGFISVTSKKLSSFHYHHLFGTCGRFSVDDSWECVVGKDCSEMCVADVKGILLIYFKCCFQLGIFEV